MQVDSFTVLLFGLLIKLVLGGLFAAFWFNNRGSPWFGWWSASLACGSVTAALYMLRPSVAIRHADGAVSAAKRAGRNRVVMADAAHVLRLAVGAAGAWSR